MGSSGAEPDFLYSCQRECGSRIPEEEQDTAAHLKYNRNMNEKPLIVFISGIDLISKILYPGIYNISVLAKN